MSRTIVSLPDEDKTWLARQASAQRVPMSELVRRAVREDRGRHGNGKSGRLTELLNSTRGTWKHGDGLRYQSNTRKEWEQRH